MVALAIHYEADFIVTRNLRDFPPAVLSAFDLEAIDPDAFIGLLWIIDRTKVIRAAELHRTSLSAHPLTPAEYHQSLRTRAHLTETAARLERAGFPGPDARRI